MNAPQRKGHCTQIMRTFTLETLERSVFDKFSSEHPQGNFQQSSAMGQLRASLGARLEYLGVREGGRLVAAGMLEVHKSRLSTFAVVHDGPLCDYHDQELLSFFLRALRLRAREAGASQLELTPEVVYQLRNADGRPVPGSPADDRTVSSLTLAGYIHEGLTTGYGAVPRWRFVKDLSGIKDEKGLVASYAKSTKRNVRIALSSGVKVQRATRDQLGTFHDICELSCEKQGFENHETSYYEAMFDALADAVEFNIAYIDSREYLESWIQKRDEYQAECEALSKSLQTARTPEKVQKKLDDMSSKHEASLRRVEDAKAYIRDDGEWIPAAAAAFAWHERECVYLFSGSDPKYAKFYAATAIQHSQMLSCIERGCARYNFYGINGVFDDPQDPGRGLLEFKQGFGGFVEEMVGTFTLPVRPLVFAAKQLAHRILRR